MWESTDRDEWEDAREECRNADREEKKQLQKEHEEKCTGCMSCYGMDESDFM